MALASTSLTQSQIPLPKNVYKLVVKVRGAMERLYISHGRLPTDVELAEEMGFDISRIDIIRKAMHLEAKIKKMEINNSKIGSESVSSISFMSTSSPMISFNDDNNNEEEERELLSMRSQRIASLYMSQAESTQSPPSAEFVEQKDSKAALLRALGKVIIQTEL